jgi:hypothetical protein
MVQRPECHTRLPVFASRHMMLFGEQVVAAACRRSIARFSNGM